MAGPAPIDVELQEPAAPPPTPEVRALQTSEGHVALVDGDGQIQEVPTANAEKAIRQFGYRPATDTEVFTAQTGALGTAAAAATGVGRGALGGLYDLAAVEGVRAVDGNQKAEQMRNSLRMLKEGHDTVSFVGELAGSLAPLTFGGAPGAAVAGESALARAGARAVAAAPRMFAEGAAIAVSQQLSEDVLGNHDLLAQKYLTRGLEGGVFGVLLGAGLHAGGGAIADKLAARNAAKALESAGVKAEGKAASAIGTKASSFAEEQAAKSFLPGRTLAASELGKLGRNTEEQMARFRRIGRAGIDEGIVTAGATKATMADRLTRRIEEVGAELGELRKGFDKATVRPSTEAIGARIKAEVLDPLMSKRFAEAERRAIEPHLLEIADEMGNKKTFDSFEQLSKLRRDLDDIVYPKSRHPGFAPPSPPVGAEHLEKIRGILEDEFERTAELAAQELGENTAAKYLAKKALFSDLKTASKWATKAASDAVQHQALSLTDVIAAGSGIASGHIGLAVLAPIANKLRRTYGNQAAAIISDRAARLMGVQRAAEAYDARVGKAVQGFFEKKADRTSTASKATKKLDPEMMRALRAATQNPEALNDHVARVVESSGLRKDAPKIAEAMTRTLVRAAAWAGQNIPPEPPPATFAFGPTKPRSLGPYAQAKAEAAIGAMDVEGLLTDLENGRVDRQKVEALKFINPDAYDDIVKKMRDYGIANQASLSHQQEVALSLLTGQPIGAMMQPRTIQGFQEAHASQGPAPEPGAGGGQTKPIGNAGSSGISRAAMSLQPRSERMEAGDV